jgi:selenocysteine-specific elongation factor
MDIVAGTAGHIDHGKTTLIQALTGEDADRLPEEKQRGITIDLGFAEMIEGDVRIGFVDVPGHERFVKNMLAGASGIDLVLLVIAADEGVMPQTREHFEICRLLDVSSGMIVITKKDTVDEELLELVQLDAAELVQGSFLENAPVFAVSSRTGEGVQELKEGLIAAARAVRSRSSDTVARLPIDRSFSVKGFGAVITGTLASGEIAEADELELLPIGKRVRVRGLQTHGRTVREAHAGQRTAINLGGIDHHDIVRGMVLTEPGVLQPMQIFDAEVEVLPDVPRALRSRQRVRAHIGTAEVLARLSVLNDAGEIEPGGSGFVQFRLESPVAAIPGERFIVRSYSPQVTIAGGRILQTFAKKHRRKDSLSTGVLLKGLSHTLGKNSETLKLIVQAAGEHGINRTDVQTQTGWRDEIVDRAVEANVRSGSITVSESVLVTGAVFDGFKAKAVEAIKNHHSRESLARGISREMLRERAFRNAPAEIIRAVLADLERSGAVVAEKDVYRLPSHSTELAPQEKRAFDHIRNTYQKARLEVPKLDEVLTDAAKFAAISKPEARKVFQLFLNSGEIVGVTDEYFFMSAVIDELVKKLNGYAASTSDRLIDVARFKDIASVSRKYAIPLLEYFDREKITRRAGDKRLIL